MTRRKKKQSSKKPLHNKAPQAVSKEINIQSLAHDGRGVGRDDGKVVFIDGALPGEKVRYTQTESRKKFAKGVTTEVIEKSKHRVSPQCKVFGKCGGCALQHVSSKQQIIYKEQQLIENLQKIGEVSAKLTLEPIVAQEWAYRRRARFGATFAHTKNEVRLGFRARNSHYIQPITTCDIVDLHISKLLPELHTVLSALDTNDAIQGVDICKADNALAICILYDGMMLNTDTKQLIAFAKQHELQLSIKNGSEVEQLLYPKVPQALYYEFSPMGIRFEFLATDFTQVNAEVNELLVKHTIQLLDIQNTDTVLDLFCGLGNFTLPLARQAHQVTGVEGDSALISRANHNKEINQFDNVDFHVCNLFDDNLPDVDNNAWLNQQFDKIVLDPPRAGAAKIIQNIDRFGAKKIVYISCDPATLSRDANVLVNQHGYCLTAIGVADMFPQTAHVESIAVFEI